MASRMAYPLPHFPIDPHVYADIPSRVRTTFKLEVKSSTISGAGRGIFVMNDVKANELVFAISEPLLNIVTSPRNSRMESVCDNCLAYHHGQSWSVPGAVVMRNCTRCHVLSYCNKKCQESAWEHHHKHECKVLKALKAQTYLKDPNEVQAADMENVRCMVRLLMLRKKKKISDSQWQEITSLKPLIQDKDGDYLAFSQDIINKILIPFVKPRQEQGQLLEIMCAIHNNGLGMFVPILFDRRYLSTSDGAILRIGRCVDPFAAMINHSCIGNAAWRHEGKEFQIRARVDLKSGDELFIPYATQEDYCERTSELLRKWGIECSCSLCAEGPKGPFSAESNNLRQRVFDLMGRSYGSDKECKVYLQDLLKCKTLLKFDHHGWDAWPYRDIFLGLIRVHIKMNKPEEALKYALRSYYLVEQASEFYVNLFPERIYVLSLVVKLLGAEEVQKHWFGENKTFPFERQDLPRRAQDLASRGIYLQLRSKLGEDIDACFGKDSLIAMHYNYLFKQEIGELTVDACTTRNYEFQFVPMSKDRNERDWFVVNMNKLLRWAEVPGRTLQLLMAR